MIRNSLYGYRIVVVRSAKKFLTKVPKKDFLSIEKSLKLLIAKNHNLDIKRLESIKYPTYRMRVKDYRILYEIYKNEVIVKVIKIAHRKDAYKF